MTQWKPEEYILENQYYQIVKSRGFDHVRLPVNFSLYLQSGSNTVDPAFFQKIDTAINLALNNGLYLILDMHGCGNINSNASGYEDMLYALWRQVAERYKNYGDHLLFEILNEPNMGGSNAPDPLTPARFNGIQQKCIRIIRSTNPTRVIVADVDINNQVGYLQTLSIPEDDPNIIVTVHSYEPIEFTHQGVTWSAPAHYPAPAMWTDDGTRMVTQVINAAAQWSQQSGRQVWVGEFGTDLADGALPAEVVKYLTTFTQLCESKGIGWCYWEFWMGFGAFDRHTGQWKDFVVNALVPR